MHNIKNMIGKRFSRLTILSREGSDKAKNATWLCICDCGNKIIAPSNTLKKGEKKSCGCLLKETRVKNAKNMGKGNEQNLKERFFKYVDKLTTSKKCWEWTGDIEVGGYGRFWYKGKSRKAHRISYLKHIGKIPQGVLVCHTCDNPKCVNPGHLFLGTNQDNYDDMVNKGRRKKVPNSKKRLTEKQVVQILKEVRKGELVKTLALKFNVSLCTISGIKNNRIWKNIPR